MKKTLASILAFVLVLAFCTGLAENEPDPAEGVPDYVNGFLAAEKESGRIDELAEEYIYRYIEPEEALQPAA